ncbi:unnamed protein product [Euphydryas editha]|uniref:Reverse transcriptase domain-containing protein n=1 Tax=Euphydryas editha TaxID=104508 RepID=A0AAU9V6N6_EUPED|nr:unnamed protein product [Euphydryas editha]
MLNWKSPGLDKIHNYYIKYLTSVHKYLASLFTNIVSGKEPLEEWFTTGKVILVPKNENTEDPKNWRPIACLPSMYKLLTSVLANVLYSHCHENNIMAEEQRGCRRGVRGCKDHLMVNKAILEDAHQSQRNLSVAWIDYRKAFDSVSHEWLLKLLDIYKCPPMIKKFLLLAMSSWRVIMTARGSHESITTEPIYIRRGIFQGDSLSPLLFCLALNPLSFVLNKYETKGYKLKDSIWINHLLYMDDLKVYANNRNSLKVLLDSVEIFTSDIGINTYAIPVLLYSFGIINYKNSDLKKIDVKTRKLLAIKKAHQQKAETERLYLPINQGGRGLLNVEYMYKAQIVKYKQYLKTENGQLIKAIVQHDTSRDKYSLMKEAQEIETELHLPQGNAQTDEEIRKSIVNRHNEIWRNKQLHGQFPKKALDQSNIDKELSFKWIKKQQISPSIESSIFAIQDQAVMTRQHQRDILKEPVDGKCRLCASKDETTQHIISGCEKLAGTYYVKRHNNLVQYVYWCLARQHKMEVSNLWWKETLTQPQVKENNSAKIMWEIPVQTDVTITHNRPDLIYTNKENNKTYLIDVTVPSDYNIGAKEIEKLSKYHLLKTEISRLWNTQTSVIPIIIGATGIVAKSIKKYLEQLDSNIDISILQKQAAIHTSIILSKVLGDTVFVHDIQDPLPQNTQLSGTQQLAGTPHFLNRTHEPNTNTLQRRGRGRGRRRRATQHAPIE